MFTPNNKQVPVVVARAWHPSCHARLSTSRTAPLLAGYPIPDVAPVHAPYIFRIRAA